MTETEWLAFTDPTPMLRFLLGTSRLRVMDVEAFPDCKVSDRKLRLFACACYDRLCHLLPDPLARDAVAVAERYADRPAGVDELQWAFSRLQASLDALEGTWRASRGAERAAVQPTYEALALALQVTRPEAPKAAYYASSNAYLAAASRTAEERAQADVLRCLFGPLLFRPVPLDPSWLPWNDGTVPRLAQAIYDDRAFDRLPILADGLEDAGCDDDAILAHCRQAGEHVRGCWVVDLLLGKE
jgi:hypothetical protein